MAYLLEKEYNLNTKINQIPYRLAEEVAEYYSPEFAKNKLFIIALCDISLMFSNPAIIFVLYLKLIQNGKESPKNIEDIYNYMKNFKFENKRSYNDIYKENIELTKKQINELLTTKHYDSTKKWLINFIEKVSTKRINNEMFFINMINTSYKEKIINKLYTEIGFPPIYNGNEMNCTGEENIDPYVFRAIFEVYNILKIDNKECNLYKYCNNEEKPITNQKCKTNPILRCKEELLCPLAQVLHMWGLSNFI